jgi:hypothetical protein
MARLRPAPDKLVRLIQSFRFLADLGGDALEGLVQVGADSAQNRDQGNGDQGGDQAILDGSGAGFVFSKAIDELGHVIFSWIDC